MAPCRGRAWPAWRPARRAGAPGARPTRAPSSPWPWPPSSATCRRGAAVSARAAGQPPAGQASRQRGGTAAGQARAGCQRGARTWTGAWGRPGCAARRRAPTRPSSPPPRPAPAAERARVSSRAWCLLGGAASAAGPAGRRTRPSTVPSSAFCCSCRRCAASSSSALPSFLRRALWCGSARRWRVALGPAPPGRGSHSRFRRRDRDRWARAGAQLDAAEEQVRLGGRRPGPLGGRRGRRSGLRRRLLPRLPARRSPGAVRGPPSRYRQAAGRARRAAPRAGGLAPPLPRGLHLRRLAVRARRRRLIGVPPVPQRLRRAPRRRGPRAGAQRGRRGGRGAHLQTLVQALPQLVHGGRRACAPPVRL